MAMHPLSRARQAGLSLIEILIGIAIGMIAIIIIMQTLTIWEQQRRSTTSGADAQMNGSIGMYELDRDIKNAGLGFGSASGAVLNCDVQAANTDRGGDFTFKLLPVSITSDDENGLDEIAVLYGNSKQLVADVAFGSSTATTKVATRQGGFLLNDVVVVSRESGVMACDMMEVTANNNPDGKTLEHIGSKWNRSAGTGSYTSGFLFNLGSKPQRHVWRVRNGSLEFYDDLVTPVSSRDANSQQIAEQIVGLKAQYGVASTPTSGVDSWVTEPGAGFDWSSVRAIRVGLLARSRQYERILLPDGTCCVDVTASVPVWAGTGAGASTDAPFVLKNLDGSDGSSTPTADPDNWRRYRYRVYESIIPLRNVVWGMSTAAP